MIPNVLVVEDEDALSALLQYNLDKEGYRVTVTREMYTLSDDRDTLTKVRRVVNMDGVTETSTVLHRQ